MKLEGTAQQLFDEISKIPIIDAHEHLPPEKEYLKFEYSGLNFFAGYIWNDMVSAGMSEDFRRTMRDPGYKPVSEWWPRIAPYWEKVRYGSHARAALITASDLYGIEDINDNTIERLAASIIADNSPGLYHRILKEKCNIRTVLSCVDRTDFEGNPYFRVVPHMDISGYTKDSFIEMGESAGRKITTLKNFVDVSTDRLHQLKESGFVAGFKILSVTCAKPDRDTASDVFNRIYTGDPVTDISPLKDYLFDKMIRTVESMNLPVAVHAGLMGGDFSSLDPKFTMYFAKTYPRIHFDLFHLGMPMVRDAVAISKTYPNVSLNLCWCPVISQRMTAHALDEIIDLVPLNKITAFGGDYRCVVQKVWGHLVMAREIVASVLAGRIESGEITEERAVDIARMWFHDNPSEIYRV